QRTDIALLMADADARTLRTQDEFAIYDSVLQELAAKADRMPLGTRTSGTQDYPLESSPEMEEPGGEENPEDSAAKTPARFREQQLQRLAAQRRAFQLKGAAVVESQAGARSPEYARVLERYLARLVELKQIPLALGVLRREIEHNPD